MYPNLEAEMARKKIKSYDIAEALDIDERTARNKLNGKTRFFYIETLKIKDTFFPALNLEYLFEIEADKQVG